MRSSTASDVYKRQLIDPVIVYVFLFPYVSLLPLASRKYYDKPIAGKIMKLVNAIPIEDLQAG
jgi:hypothetical protein